MLPERPVVSAARLAQLARIGELTRRNPPADLAAIIRDELKIDLAASYAGFSIPHPFGKGSGQLSTTLQQVESDVEAGLAFAVLKTVIAEDEQGSQSMSAWTVRETRMKVEHRNGWTVTWKGRGWHGTFAEYLGFFRDALGAAPAMPVIPSVKYHLPAVDESFREGEYAHATRSLLAIWERARGQEPMPIEKDFSPTLAGDDRGTQQASILRWLREVPGLVAKHAPGARIGVKVMNALFDDAFQVDMVKAAAQAGPSFLVAFNRLFDPERKVAYGGYDLSDRNLRVLDLVRDRALPPISATGNICSGKMMVEYALRGATSGQLHTFFQLPLSEYSATGGSRTARALHTLMLHPDLGIVAWLWHLNETGTFEARDGNLHFLDVSR